MSGPNIAWIDAETTGLDANKNQLLEIAVVVTDSELNVLDEGGFHAVVAYTTDEVAAMFGSGQITPYVMDMHTKTGLWDKLSGPDAKSRTDIQFDLLRYLVRFGEPKTMPIAGNSVRLDANFLDVHLPYVAEFLSYRLIDVSSIAALATSWYGLPLLDKKSDHTAAVDIRESIRELKHWREAAFRNAAEDRALIVAHDVASCVPQGTMTQEQWSAFAGLINAAEAVVTRVESHGHLTHPVSETDHLRAKVELLLEAWAAEDVDISPRLKDALTEVELAVTS